MFISMNSGFPYEIMNNANRELTYHLARVHGAIHSGSVEGISVHIQRKIVVEGILIWGWLIVVPERSLVPKGDMRSIVDSPYMESF